MICVGMKIDSTCAAAVAFFSAAGLNWINFDEGCCNERDARYQERYIYIV